MNTTGNGEGLSNRVFFSALLPEVCPVTYSGLVEILDRYGVPHSLLEGTKDIWCRDYMPIQTIDKRFVLFRYEPDYLLDTAKHKASITDNSIAGLYVGSSYLEDSRGIKIDGGNVVHSRCKVIMTAKVFEENPQWTPRDLIEYLTRAFGADIIILPWDTNEIYGHTDGIVRFIDDDSVLMTNYAHFDPVMASRFRRILRAHFTNVHELSFRASKSHEYSWAYINWLQTEKVLILPKFNIPEDQDTYSGPRSATKSSLKRPK